MTHTTEDEEAPTLNVPADAVEQLFEPWDALDAAIERLERETRTNAGAPGLVAAVVTARDVLRGPLYAVMRAYQVAFEPYGDETDGDDDDEEAS